MGLFGGWALLVGVGGGCVVMGLSCWDWIELNWWVLVVLCPFFVLVILYWVAFSFLPYHPQPIAFLITFLVHFPSFNLHRFVEHYHVNRSSLFSSVGWFGSISPGFLSTLIRIVFTPNAIIRSLAKWFIAILVTKILCFVIFWVRCGGVSCSCRMGMFSVWVGLFGRQAA